MPEIGSDGRYLAEEQGTWKKFWDKVRIADGTGCWEWAGEVAAGGYGRIYLGFKQRKVSRAQAHRWAYERLVGPIPEGLELDHLCRNRRCVNPMHLEPVTGRVNKMRGTSPSARNHAKVRCNAGHALFGENLYVTPNGRRQCKQCRAAAVARYQARKRS